MSRPSLTGSSLAASKLLPADEADPMESMGNLMDVMLVFICGLLIALVMRWNVDLTSSTPEASVQPVDSDSVELVDGVDIGEGSFTEYGTVYRNEETGELYIVA